MLLTPNTHLCDSSSGRTARCFCPQDFSISTLKNFFAPSHTQTLTAPSPLPADLLDPQCCQGSILEEKEITE